MFKLFPYADLSRLADWEGVAAGSLAIVTVGMIATVIVAVGSLPAGLVSMPLAYMLRRRKDGLGDDEDVGLDIFDR